MADYIPNKDTEFNAWQDNFVAKANANLAGLGLVAGDMAGVMAAQTVWATRYPEHLDAQGAASAARVAKDAARVSYEFAIRTLVRRLQASASVDDGERAMLGITVPGGNGAPQGPPATMPMIMVMCERLQHVLEWKDSGTPTRKAKPPGVLGAELRVALTPIGSPTPTDPDAFSFMALDTATPYTKNYNAADGGKNAHYIARWVTTQQEFGPWSETVSVTVGA